LQAAGVRCWFAPEDLKIGDRFRDEIEDAIRMHDKLLLVLSENSVQSDWVRSEVEGALRREARENRSLLFPVRLDDAVMDSAKGWAGACQQRHIGDFSSWKDHDSYKRSFDRMLPRPAGDAERVTVSTFGSIRRGGSCRKHHVIRRCYDPAP
jgi:TIR domain